MPHHPMDAAGGAAQPLASVVVADFSRVLAGPAATMVLADLGATVIKVEHPQTGDDTRHWGPPWTSSGSSYFDAANRSKRSIGLDLRKAEDLDLAHTLMRRADVLVENFRVGGLDKYGLDPQSTLAANPRLVHCSITGFGSKAGARLPGYDFIVQALGGLMSITGQPGAEPQKVGVALVDVLTGKDAVIGILAALTHRQTTGTGQHVEVNLLQSLLGSLANQASAFLATGTPPARMGNQHPSIAPYETLHTSDGLLAVACGNDRQFARFSDVVGAPHLSADTRFVTNSDRVTNRVALVAELERHLASRPAKEWQQLLTQVDVPAGTVKNIAEAIALAETLGLGPVITLKDGSRHVAHPISYSGFETAPPSPSPQLGQHTDEVRQWLTATAQATNSPTHTPTSSEESA